MKTTFKFVKHFRSVECLSSLFFGKSQHHTQASPASWKTRDFDLTREESTGFVATPTHPEEAHALCLTRRVPIVYN